MPHRSDHAGFRALSPQARRDQLVKAGGVSETTLATLTEAASLPLGTADGMIENVIGTFEIPLGVALNFTVNSKDYLVPMAVEEPSVVAAASFMAKLVRSCGGFHATATAPLMRGQIQILNVSDPHGAEQRLLAARDEIVAMANSQDQVLVDLGGGCIDIEVHQFPDTPVGPMVVLHLLVDVRDAMGANTVNTMAEHVAPRVASLAEGDVRLRILSNLADKRIVRAWARLSPEALATDTLEGTEVAQGIVEACALALVDPYRAATHNKGIMNGIDPVVLATGNDWRAIEAGAHAYAARSGQYSALTRWERAENGDLVGTIALPMALGLVGGATKTHPGAKAALALLDVESSSELGMVVAAVGLAQNMAALRALATEGIQRGHMALHARNIAITAGATGPEVDALARRLVADGEITVDHALKLRNVRPAPSE